MQGDLSNSTGQDSNRDLASAFERYFEVLIADTPQLVREAQALRYQVYCVENPFEDASRFPDELEVDGYDTRSVHGLVRHRESNLLAATVRLVLPDPADKRALFPIEEHCASAFRDAEVDTGSVPRSGVAEISRFAVSKRFKRRLGERGTIAGVAAEPDRYTDSHLSGARLFPHLTLGLFAAIVQLSAQHGVGHWYAVMEPSLFRLLTRFGIVFTPIGDPIDYHGLRQACFGAADQVLAGIWRRRPDVWRLITGDGSVWPNPEVRAADMAQALPKPSQGGR